MTKYKEGDIVRFKKDIIAGVYTSTKGGTWSVTQEVINTYKDKDLKIYRADTDETYTLKTIEDNISVGNGSWYPDVVLTKVRKRAVKEDAGGITEKLEKAMQDGFKENNEEIGKMLDKMTDIIEEVRKESPIEKAMKEAIIEKGREIATQDLEERLKAKLDAFIQEKYGILPKQIIIKKADTDIKLEGIFHKDFEKICNIVANNIPLMLVGGAGAGKNYTLEQVAKGLGLTFYSTNAINQEYKLTGFIDANGIYHETEFYKAFTNGGMFFLDEIDASSPEALIILNSAIANKYFDFPIGRVQAHKDFRVVCAGNTYGTGADMIYVGRNVLDGATLDRFVVLNFDYDEQVERQLAYNEELYLFIKDLRDAINESNLRYIVSMRALINSTKLLEIGIDKETILKTVIIKNMQRDDINTIVDKLKTSSEWTRELKKLSDR